VPPNETPLRRDAEKQDARGSVPKIAAMSRPRLQVSMLLPNVGRIFLDNFAVLHYERPPVRRFGVPDSGFANRLPVQRSKLHHFNT